MARCPMPAVLLLLLTAGAAPAAEPPTRVPLPGESPGTGRRLEAADKLAADKQYAAAAEEYVRILEEVGDDLVPVDERLSMPARRLCHLRLAALPAEARNPYRAHVDPQAKKWLDQGRADHDTRPLQRLVDEAFCSRPADAALDLLGDLAFERGRFHEAERWWRQLALPASEEKDKGQRTKDEKGANAFVLRPLSFDLLYPDPQVDIARVRAKQVLALLFRGEATAAKAELEAFRTLHPKSEGHLAGRKGNYADTLQAVGRQPIPPEPADDAWPTFAGDAARAAVLPAHPKDPNRLNRLVERGPAWDLHLDIRPLKNAERPLRWSERPPAKPGPKPVPIGAAEQARQLPFHPVILGGLVLVADARGVIALNPAALDPADAIQTWELGKDYPCRLNDANGLKLNLQLPAPADLRYTLTVADGRVYARLGVQGLPQGPPLTKPGAEFDSFLACLEIADPGWRLKAVWVRPAEAPGNASPAIFEGAPVVRDGHLYVAATRFEANQMITEIRCYAADSDAPPRWTRDVAAARDLPPGLRYRHQLVTLAGQHVVYASHAGSIVALDARTGRRAWAARYPSAVVKTPGGSVVPRDLAPAVYADGRLYVAPADYDRLLCLDPETGQVIWERERLEVIHLLGVGNGRLIFTTTKGIRAVRAADGDDNGGWQMPDAPGPDGLPSYGRGFLAGDCVFWPTPAGVQVLSQVDGRPPDDLIPGPLALHNLAPGNLAYAGGILAVADAVGLRVYLPPDRGRDEAPDPPPAGAAGAADALDALARQGVALAAAGRSAESLAVWQRILADHTLRQGVLHDGRRLPQVAAVVAAERIDDLVRAHGPALYAPAEQKARSWLASAEDDAVALERLAQEYPNAAAAGQALRQLARVYEKSGHWGAVSHTYRRLLRRELSADERKAAIAGLSRAEEQERKQSVPSEPSDQALSLARSWEKEERLLPSSDGVPESSVFLVRGTALVCRDAATGAERWTRPVAESPTWAGRHADIAVVAGPDAVRAFALSDGTPLWRLPAPDPATFLDPRLSGFRLAGDHLFCLQGECRLLALDVATGQVLWQHWAPAARLTAEVPGCRFSPHYLATAEWVLLQFAGRCRLLDARTGLVVRDLPLEKILWEQSPLPLGGQHVGIVTGRQRVVALDPTSGQVAWSHSLPRPDSLTGELPLLVGGPDALFVIVPRNYGQGLQRLDPRTGQVLWPEELDLGPERIEPHRAAVDDNGVYYTSRNVVTALARNGGRLLWEQALPGPSGAWCLCRVGRMLLAWPAEARRAKFHSRWLTASLELDVTLPPEDRPGRGIPLLVLDPLDGAVVQRLNFIPPFARAQGQLATDEELTAMPSLLTERAAADGPMVQLTRGGLVVGWDSKVWALRGDR